MCLTKGIGVPLKKITYLITCIINEQMLWAEVCCTCFKGALALVLAWVGPQQTGFHGTDLNGSADLNSPGRNGGE